MRCRIDDGESWTTVRVQQLLQQLRERLAIAAFDPSADRIATISADEAAARLGICVGSVHRLIQDRDLPTEQAMHSAPWKIPVAALDSDTVLIRA